MEDEEDFTAESLQMCSYRFLQQTAKRLNLPSNVKKIYLIQLIHMKKYGHPEEVEKLAKKVRTERKLLSQVRKKSIRRKRALQHQIAEISSTSNSVSPPITRTPKRASRIMIRYSPNLQSPITFTRRHHTRYQTGTSDRVLRSFKSVNTNNDSVLNNTLMDIIRASNEKREESMSQERKYQQINMTYIKRRSDAWTGGIVPVQRSMNVSPQPIRKQRRLSGIYPLNEPNVAVRRSDGTLSKIKAFIQKTVKNYNHNDNRSLINTQISQRALQNRVLTPQIMYNNVNSTSQFNNRVTSRQIAENSYNNIESYDVIPSNVSNEESYEITSTNFNKSEENYEIMSSNVNRVKEDNYAVYYHKKIRGEQIRSLKTREFQTTNERLPRISDVFSQFNSVCSRDVTQPIYVQVDKEPDVGPNLFAFRPDLPCNQTSMLESLFNVKNTFLVNQPLLQICTTANTKCVYSTPIISTAKAQPSASSASLYNFASEQDSEPYYMTDEMPRVHDFFKNFRCEEEVATLGFKGSGSSTESVTIPEMVEDALELISQDGDYMERMGMDTQMQCLFCNWAGPKIILELHIRKNHPTEIFQAATNSWCATYSLGALGRAWCSRVLEFRHQLYVLSAKYDHSDCFVATLSILSSDADTPKSARMIIYNKLSGEPFTWEGEIQQLPPSLSFEDSPHYFKLEISKIDLLPNSANLKLLNKELVIKSPTKVVVGQPELDNIHISLFVKLFDME